MYYSYVDVAKETVVLTDKLGKDHLFLKGHEYAIETDSDEEYIYKRGGGNHVREYYNGRLINEYTEAEWIQIIKKTSFLLTKEQYEQYFEQKRVMLATGGCGNPRMLGFGKMDNEEMD